jgi:gamma-glutamylputrescine oxidase
MSSDEGEVDNAILQEYPQTFYTATRKEPFVNAPGLVGEQSVDVCVIGGGLAGIATALGVAERGKSVAVVERKRVGSEASGMNGGMAIPGFAVEGWDLVELAGKDKARTMFRWSMEAFEKMQQRIVRHNIQCDFSLCGQIMLSCFAGGEHEAREDAEELNTLFGTRLEVWPRKKVKELFFSNNYYHGVFDPDVASLHPLNFTLGLARAARAAGVHFFERTSAVNLAPGPAGSGRRWCVTTDSAEGQGKVHADHVVLAGGSSIGGVGGSVGRSLVPLLTFIMCARGLWAFLSEVR